MPSASSRSGRHWGKTVKVEWERVRKKNEQTELESSKSKSILLLMACHSMPASESHGYKLFYDFDMD